MCSERVTTTWSASSSLGDPPAVVADHRDRHEASPARLGERLDHVARVARRRQREQRRRRRRRRRSPAARRSPRRRCRWRSRSGSRDPRSGRSPAADPAARGSRRRRPSRRSPSRRCRARAACRRARSSRAARPPPPRSTDRVLGQRLLAQRADLLGLHQHRAAHVLEDRVELALALVEERIQEARRAGVVDAALARGPRAARGARRTRARAPTARGRASRPAPGGCRVVAGRLELPLGARAGANAIVRQPRRARATATAVAAVSSAEARSRCRRARAISATWAAEVAALAGQPDAPAAPACRRSPGGRTRPRRGGRPSAPPASGRTRSAGRRARTARPSGGTARASRSA